MAPPPRPAPPVYGSGWEGSALGGPPAPPAAANMQPHAQPHGGGPHAVPSNRAPPAPAHYPHAVHPQPPHQLHQPYAQGGGGGGEDGRGAEEGGKGGRGGRKGEGKSRRGGKVEVARDREGPSERRGGGRGGGRGSRGGASREDSGGPEDAGRRLWGSARSSGAHAMCACECTRLVVTRHMPAASVCGACLSSDALGLTHARFAVWCNDVHYALPGFLVPSETMSAWR